MIPWRGWPAEILACCCQLAREGRSAITIDAIYDRFRVDLAARCPTDRAVRSGVRSGLRQNARRGRLVKLGKGTYLAPI